MPKLYIKTFGCQMNEYDSLKMADVLRTTRDFERTDDPEAADLLLLNTCSVREKAQEKVFSELGRWREWKLARPGRMIGVGGCVASQEGEDLVRRARLVDVVFGPQTLHRLPELLDRARRGEGPAVDVRFPEIEKFDHLPEPRAEGCSALVSIMEGCSKYCSFCIVPYTRGEEVSRPLVDVLAEVQSLVAQGVREVTLLGQNVNAYRGAMPDGRVADLALLLACLSAIEPLGRLRFTTSHPLEFDEALVTAFATLPKLADYLHLPVQSGSDRILGMMKRGYTRADYLQRVRRLRVVRPGVSLSSDFIVGFPSETEADFEETLRLIDEAGVDQAFSFIYSARPGTPAANLRDSLPAEAKRERLDRLQARVRARGIAFTQAMIGTLQPVLVERPARKGGGMMSGRTPCNRWVNFPGAPDLAGRFVQVRILEALANSLRGAIESVPAQGSAIAA